MNNRSWRLISVSALALGGLLLGTACNKQENTEQSANNTAETAMTAPAATPIDPATVATVNGTVKFDGAAPKLAHIDMSQDPACKGMNEAETIAVDNGNLPNFFFFGKEGWDNPPFVCPRE